MAKKKRVSQNRGGNGSSSSTSFSSNPPPQQSSSSSSSTATEPPPIPGFHFDQQTGRYYSLSNAPAEFLNRLAKERSREENERALKHFKGSLKVTSPKSKSKRAIFNKNLISSWPSHLFHSQSKPRSFSDALFCREIGNFHHQNRLFLESLSGLCAARLPLQPEKNNLNSQPQPQFQSMPQLESIPFRLEAQRRLSPRVQKLVDLCKDRPCLLYCFLYRPLGSSGLKYMRVQRDNFSITGRQQQGIFTNSFLIGPTFSKGELTSHAIGVESLPVGNSNRRHSPSWTLTYSPQKGLNFPCSAIGGEDHLVAALVPDLLHDPQEAHSRQRQPFFTSRHMINISMKSPEELSSRNNNHRHRRCPTLALQYCLSNLPAPAESNENSDFNDEGESEISRQRRIRNSSQRYVMRSGFTPFLILNQWPWTEEEEELRNFHRRVVRNYQVELNAQQGSPLLEEIDYLGSNSPLFNHLRRLTYSACRRETVTADLADAHLTCVDLQFFLQNKTEQLRTGNLPSGALSGFSDGILQLAEWINSSVETTRSYLPTRVSTWRVAATRKAIRSVKFHPTRPTQVVVAADQGFLGLYDTQFLKEGDSFIDCKVVKPLIVFEGHHSTTHCTPPSLDPFGSDLMVCAGEDGLVRFWSTSTGKLVNLFEPFPDADRDEALSMRAAYSSCFKLAAQQNETDNDGRFEGEALLVVSDRFAQLHVSGVPDFVQPSQTAQFVG